MILPPSTNTQYSGSLWSAWFLMAYGCLELLPGLIHYCLPDGGAGVIAGLDLSNDRAAIVGTFAWMGSMQIPFGIALIIIGWRYRSLVPLFLIVIFLERVLMALAGWVLRPSSTGHHPPEHYGSVVAIVLIALFLWLSLVPAAPRLDGKR